MKSLPDTTIEIDYLAHYPQHIATLAQWQQNQWHDISPELDVDKRIAFMTAHPAKAHVPTTLVALNKQQLMGSASLIDNDMEDRPQYTPWLASVYITPEHRNQGAATLLISKIIQQAQQLELSAVYLFTPDQVDFYARRGWQHIEQRHYHGTMVDIMIYSITPTKMVTDKKTP